MEANPRELIIYETEQGEAPFPEWLDSLRDRSARARIRKRLDSRSERLHQRVELGNFGDLDLRSLSMVARFLVDRIS
jgi:putative component of toxin-antitoxin plasmid stabilization module